MRRRCASRSTVCFLGNLLTVGIAWVLQLHQPLQMSTNLTPDVDFLKEMGWLMVWGTALLYVDSLGIILLYEKLGDFFRRRVVLRFLISGLRAADLRPDRLLRRAALLPGCADRRILGRMEGEDACRLPLRGDVRIL